MLDPDWRKSQSQHNIVTQVYLQNKHPEYTDWEITSIFYASLQLVDEYFRNKISRVPYSHKIRTPLVKSSSLNPIYPEYHKLVMLSQKSRYKTHHSTLTSNERNAAFSYYEKIKQFILPQI